MPKDPSKTEKATPRRRQKAREEGQVLKSQDVPVAFSLISVSLVLIFYFPFAFKKLTALFYYAISQSTYLDLSPILATSTYVFFFLVFPVFLILFVVGVLGNIIQFGFVFTFKTLIPKISNINPITGVQRIFSLKTLFETIKSSLKLVVAAIVGYYAVVHVLSDFSFLSFLPLKDEIYLFARDSVLLFFVFGLLSVPIAAIDYLFRRWEYEENLKMSKQEVKEERKQQEGHPLVKSAIRRRQREIAMKRMMAEVPKADVVITNPTHYAVALKYERGKWRAPRVVAKGVDSVALKIREIAIENGVPIEENPELARTLYETCDVGDYIPEELYRAVARILAKIYRRKGKLS